MTDLNNFKQKQDGVSYLKELIRKKQGLNKDVNSNRTYFEKQLMDPMTFTDKRLQYSSPLQQDALRNRIQTNARAGLSNIAREEQFRGNALADTLNEFNRTQTNQLNRDQENRLSRTQAFNEIKDRRALSLPIDDKAYQRAGIDSFEGSTGTSLTYRNNNPGAIKWSYGNGNRSGLSKDLEKAGIKVSKGSPMADGGYAIKFENPEDGAKAITTLLTGNYGYGDLTLEQALRKWSNNGYGSEGTGIGGQTKMSEIAMYPTLLNQLTEAIKKKEGWNSGKKIETQQPVQGTIISNSDKKSLMNSTGLTEKELSQYGDITYDKMNEIRSSFKKSYASSLTSDIKELAVDDTLSVKDQATLKNKYRGLLTNSEIYDIINASGIYTEK